MTVKFKEGVALRSMSLTPLIDVVFLLLVFFLVTARFEKQDNDQELAIQLPTAEAAQPMMMQPDEMTIKITRTGLYNLNGRNVLIAEVRRQLRRRGADNPGQSVVIQADKKVPFDAVVAVMDACNRAGITDYTVTTDQPAVN